MSMAVKIDVITREIVRPSSPTPEGKKYVKLSLLDQMNFALSTPIILFYPCMNPNQDMSHVSHRLKSSLSETLSLFYPVAGTIRDNVVIECNDKGVEYLEARVGCKLSELLRRPEVGTLEELIPIDLDPTKAISGAKIQVNYFHCGGLAIGVSLSPRIGDATALLTFILAWANSYNPNSTGTPPELVPHFVGDTIISSLNNSIGMSSSPSTPPPSQLPIDPSRRTLRLVFGSSKLELLRHHCSSGVVTRPTRVEAVTALLWKSLIRISVSKSKAVTRNCIVSHAVNYRKRFAPPLSSNYIGNLSGRYMAEANDTSLTLQDLVARLRHGLNETLQLITEGVENNDIMSPILEYTKTYLDLYGSENVDFYNFRSLCGFPLYEADFGWGRPDWVIVTNPVLKNYVLMVDTKDGKGVEAWVSLGGEEAGLLEREQELLAFADLNPIVMDDDDDDASNVLLQCRI